MIDLHTHLWRHERGTNLPTYDELARACEYAASVGVEQLAITEHCHRFEEIAAVALPAWDRSGAPALADAAERVWREEGGAQLEPYVTLLTDAQERGLPVLVGLEVDHLPGTGEAVAEVLGPYPFDVLLGSVHWLGAWLFDAYGDPVFAAEWERRSVADVWDAYADAVIALAASGLIDVVAHVDVIKVAGHRPPDRRGWEARLASALAGCGVAVEVSSAGWRKPADEPYPSDSLLALLRDAGVPFTTASDAHQMDQIGDRFTDLRDVLTAAGIDTLTTFERRAPRGRPIGCVQRPLASLVHDPARRRSEGPVVYTASHGRRRAGGRSRMTEVGFTPGGLPETVLDLEPDDAREALRAALAGPVEGRRDAVADVCARWPSYLDAWARLGQLARDDVEAYAYFRVGYHRGLDRLRRSGWRGSGYVRWNHETNRGFLRALEGLRSAAEAIGEVDEAQRCDEFVQQLDPGWDRRSD